MVRQHTNKGPPERERDDMSDVVAEVPTENILDHRVNVTSEWLPPKANGHYFLGFEVNSSPKLRELWQRFKMLEKWNELAIRPESPEDCHTDDRFLLSPNANDKHTGDGLADDLLALRKQFSHVRYLLNQHISTLAVETTSWEKDLVVRPSQIRKAGMGLYYIPSQKVEVTSVAAPSIPKDSLICYYTGHVHTHSSSRELPIEERSYLMWIRDNTLVDPGPIPSITARYINDPLNENLVNCRYVPTVLTVSGSHYHSEGYGRGGDDPHEDTIRLAVYTTRTIQSGEELFVSYGDAYWNQQPTAGNMLNCKSVTNKTNGNHCSSSKKENIQGDCVIDDENSNDGNDSDDSDISATFPFSALFDPKVIQTSLVSD
ncbi:unnamed protein product [Pseudo-nitzschia multistriata]|uniref:SET domain-containing protein n=1 Tax=Pseudo-nitzschia multistriata TaxID=183589 RepID=A0A448ZIW4_9STRA|nr:unnamed protein product [Pseudo-nitzschia multistriata]